MRIVLCCLGILFAAPAFANSMEEGLCPKASSFAEMEASEKLCRSFIQALGKLPAETTKEVRAMLSPESLAVMSSVTAAWIGTQGIPVVGQAVDASLLALGVIALSAQTAVVTDSVWKYVQYASEARDPHDLEVAANHLARAMATVGVRVGVAPGTSVAPALAITGGHSEGGRGLPTNAKPKKVSLEQFKGWLDKAKRRPTPERTEAYKYQRKHAGPEEMLVSGGGKQVWADGARMDSAQQPLHPRVEVRRLCSFNDSRGSR